MEELNSQENGDKTTLLNADRGFKVKASVDLGRKGKKKKLSAQSCTHALSSSRYYHVMC